MSLQTELKLPWPEISLQAPERSGIEGVKTTPKPAIPNYETQWSVLRAGFTGKYSRFANYLMYLSTDFSGGFKVCSHFAPNPVQNAFLPPFSPPGPPISLETVNSLWDFTRKKVWDELDRDDWELLGFAFLLFGAMDEFHEWVELTKADFEISPNCHLFLFLLGWESTIVSSADPILQSLAQYSSGNYEKCDFSLLAFAILKEGHWQLSGLLVDAIHKTVWSGREMFPFLDFLSGFYANWQTWEQAKFLNLTLGKVPPFTAVRRAQKLLPKDTFESYYKQITILMRGDFVEPQEDSGYELSIPEDPFMDTLLRFNDEGDIYTRELAELLSFAPYSYVYNLQMAIIKYRSHDYDEFLKYYALGGRLRYMPVPLYIYGRVNLIKNNVSLANSILSSLEVRNMTPIFPHDLGEV